MRVFPLGAFVVVVVVALRKETGKGTKLNYSGCSWLRVLPKW